MKAFILYSRLDTPTLDHFGVYSHAPLASSRPIYIRAELVHCDHNEAMGRVKPMPSEVFLNCVPAE